MSTAPDEYNKTIEKPGKRVRKSFADGDDYNRFPSCYYIVCVCVRRTNHFWYVFADSE